MRLLPRQFDVNKQGQGPGIQPSEGFCAPTGRLVLPVPLVLQLDYSVLVVQVDDHQRPYHLQKVGGVGTHTSGKDILDLTFFVPIKRRVYCWVCEYTSRFGDVVDDSTCRESVCEFGKNIGCSQQWGEILATIVNSISPWQTTVTKRQREVPGKTAWNHILGAHIPCSQCISRDDPEYSRTNTSLAESPTSRQSDLVHGVWSPRSLKNVSAGPRAKQLENSTLNIIRCA